MKSFVVAALILSSVAFLTVPVAAEAGGTTCTPPHGYIPFRAFVMMPKDASPVCIANGYNFTHASKVFTFEDGVLLGAEDAEHKVSKDGCKYVVRAEDVGVIFAFDRNWYRGTGMIVDGECAYPFHFVRD